MKLTRFTRKGRVSFGAHVNGGIIDLGARMKEVSDVRELLAKSLVPQAEEMAAGRTPDFAEGDFTYDLPVDAPDKIICVGINYPERNDEYKGENFKPASPYPSLFLRTARSFVAHSAPILCPPESAQLDYEGEIALVIGKGGRRIEETSALSHVAGLTLANEGTIRDWLYHSTRQITPGKNFDASGSIGPWIDTLVRKDQTLRLQTRINDELRQDDTTDRLIYSFPRLISYISTFTELCPGDIILTGTPTGAGVRFEPPRFLKDGDVLRIDVAGIGTLENPIRNEVV